MPEAPVTKTRRWRQKGLRSALIGALLSADCGDIANGLRAQVVASAQFPPVTGAIAEPCGKAAVPVGLIQEQLEVLNRIYRKKEATAPKSIRLEGWNGKGTDGKTVHRQKS
jgi:hypothetical protein